ncbi:MAG: hypothetical protein OEY67_04260 [Gammaproteobacteria bacterium]|nr:hypothetical protein [Gammaproteobacteria bacterium]
MDTNILRLLCDATNNNLRIIVRYENQTSIRVLEPHVIYSEDDGTLLADCYQVRGHTREMQTNGFWKTLQLNKINSVFILNKKFIARTNQGFSPNQPKYLNNLIAMTRLPILPNTGSPQTTNQTSLFTQARKLWWDLGSRIDRVLSDRDWTPKN